MIQNVDYHITDICNLNCVSCNHFCPLVPKSTEHKSMSKIEKDLSSLSKFKEYIDAITILGGEPTLHPNLMEILKLSRKLFPDNEIRLTTNCTNWKKFEEWKDVIVENNIVLYLSMYPYCKEYKEHANYIVNCIGKNRCVLIDLGESNMQKGPLVLRRTNTDEQILNCRMRGGCCQLKDEHLYVCNYAAQIDYLYNEFPFLKNYIFREGYEKVKLSDENTTIDDIANVVYNNIPAICFYCNECTRWIDYNMETVPWKRSEKRIEEWIS